MTEAPSFILRDYFAAAALTGYLAADPSMDCDRLEISLMAFEQADEMLAARTPMKIVQAYDEPADPVGFRVRDVRLNGFSKWSYYEGQPDHENAFEGEELQMLFAGPTIGPL